MLHAYRGVLGGVEDVTMWQLLVDSDYYAVGNPGYSTFWPLVLALCTTALVMAYDIQLKTHTRLRVSRDSFHFLEVRDSLTSLRLRFP